MNFCANFGVSLKLILTMTVRILTLIVCFTLFIAAPASAAEKPSLGKEELQVFFLPLLGSDLTRTKLYKLTGTWGNLTGTKVRSEFTNDAQKMAEGCSDQSIDFFVTSKDKAMSVLEQCDYVQIAELNTSVYLYALDGMALDTVKTVGVAQANSSYNIAKRTMPDSEFVEFENYTAAFFALLSGKVDSVAASPALYKPMAGAIAKRVTPIKTLADNGKGAVIFSAAFANSREGDIIKAQFLDNVPSMRELFVDTFGFSPWYAVGADSE